MRIGIIDAEIIGKKKHRFPNLACMKISAYFKNKNNNTELILNYEDIYNYDEVYLSKVFIETDVPDFILKEKHVSYGGTGFFYDKAPPLKHEIEHTFPDYSLYNKWIESMIKSGIKRSEFQYYLDYSIGFTTRGCFRGCEFCVNKDSKSVKIHSPINEFLDKDRKYICLLDDNILGSNKWKSIFQELNNTNKYFQYKQGMDVRLLNDEKCKILSNSKYKGDFIFAFDDINDSSIIEEKLKLWRKYTNKTTKLYVFCGFDRENTWHENFWKQDIIDTFERIKILMKQKCLPYIMRYKDYDKSPYKGTYINLAGWCNQPNFFKKTSYREYCEINQARTKRIICSAMRYLNEFEEKYPDIANIYFNMKF